jgi:hypothetical protein
MKVSLPLLAALVVGFPAMSGAFTLDFATSVGAVVQSGSPLTINIPGYGDVVFDVGVGTPLVVNSAFENDNGFGGPSLSFDTGEAVKITFNGLEPLNLDFDYVGNSIGETFVGQPDLFTPQSFVVNLQGAGNGAGIYQISWNAVPEPSSALLGLIGAAVFAFRRRR